MRELLACGGRPRGPPRSARTGLIGADEEENRMSRASQPKTVRRLIGLVASIGSIAVLTAVGPATAAPRVGPLRLLHGRSQAVCPGPAAAGDALCNSRVIPNASSSPVGIN
jgi:hypothetical protein